MPSPFPGMDPYLEDPAFWRDFHGGFIHYCRDTLNELLPEHYEARWEEHLFLVEEPDTPPKEVYSDVSIGLQHPLPTAVPTAVATKLALEPVPVELELLEEIGDPFIEVYKRPEHTLIAVVEVLSPSNKKPPDRRLYLQKRNALLRQPVHLVALDLLLGGHRLPMRQPLPRGDYFAFVSRAGERTHSEVYAWAMDQPLPTIRVPLKEPDADVLLDLQRLFSTTYNRSRYLGALRYKGPPPMSLPEQVLRWIDEVLRPLRTLPAKPAG